MKRKNFRSCQGRAQHWHTSLRLQASGHGHGRTGKANKWAWLLRMPVAAAACGVWHHPSLHITRCDRLPAAPGWDTSTESSSSRQVDLLPVSCAAPVTHRTQSDYNAGKCGALEQVGMLPASCTALVVTLVPVGTSSLLLSPIRALLAVTALLPVATLASTRSSGVCAL